MANSHSRLQNSLVQGSYHSRREPQSCHAKAPQAPHKGLVSQFRWFLACRVLIQVLVRFRKSAWNLNVDAPKLSCPFISAIVGSISSLPFWGSTVALGSMIGR